MHRAQLLWYGRVNEGGAYPAPPIRSVSSRCAYRVAFSKGASMAERATTEKQQRILEVIRDFTSERGYPPSVREIGERVGLSSSSTVQSHLKTLERHGFLKRDPTKPRALVASRSGDEPPAVESVTLPVVGRVAAGVPITATENLEDHFVLPAAWAPRRGGFMLRVKGDSMIDAAILDGDLIVVEPQPTASNGEIVVAMIDGEATVKRFFREDGRIRLQPENSAMAPIYADDVSIVGRVEAVIRKL
ncbi:LexA repressor [Vulcanimicrobium alpinum]|uniref:LexA repressor n=2 Tax=Vulcanimicrobium alpinum TaxID=3016050 RepID=A0AAN1XYB6_UNVUL|nr:LexA repressor [Vulcanimicrobium alpinum]